MKKMKKILSILLAVLLLAASATAFAAAEETAPWYELTDNEVLTVRLPANAGTGITWDYEISNPEALELLTMEVVDHGTEGMLGAPLTYVASFRGIAAGEVSLIMKATRAGEEAAMFTRVLGLTINEKHEIAIDSILIQEPAADWVEIDEEETTMTVRIPGVGWAYQIVNPEILEAGDDIETEEDLTAFFSATMEEAGFAQVVFTSMDGCHQLDVDVFVNEAGYLELLWVTTFEILK